MTWLTQIFSPQDSDFVVQEDVMTRRVALLDVLQLQFLMEVNEYRAVEDVMQPGVPNLVGVKHNIAVGTRLPATELFTCVTAFSDRGTVDRQKIWTHRRCFCR
jgi:hypothetical protein